MIIAIDGPAAAGKGTLAKALAVYLDFSYLETGLLYRAIAKKILNEKGNVNDIAFAELIAKNLKPGDLEIDGLRAETIGQAASKISSILGVRKELEQFQRNFANNPPNSKSGAILDGRDIGTVICPNANIKIFVTASIEIRAQPRLKELQNLGAEVIYAEILEAMIERDRRDERRKVAPLAPAKDAITIDTSLLTEADAFDSALKIIGSKKNL